MNRDLEQLANFNNFSKSTSLSNAQIDKMRYYQLSQAPLCFRSSYNSSAEISKLSNQSTDCLCYSANSDMHLNETQTYYNNYSHNQIQSDNNFKLKPFQVNINYQTINNSFNEGNISTGNYFNLYNRNS